MPACLVAYSCLTLCDRSDCSPPGSSVHGILPARILEWVTFSFPGDLPDPGTKPRSPAWQEDSLPTKSPGKPQVTTTYQNCMRNEDIKYAVLTYCRSTFESDEIVGLVHGEGVPINHMCYFN